MLIDRSRHRVRHFALAVVATVMVFTSASWLSAHDFFLVPGAFSFSARGDVEVMAQTSSRFPSSVAPIAFARVARAVIIGANGETPIADLSHRGTSLVLKTRPDAPGQRIVAVTLIPRSARQTGEGFLRWLELEGAADAAGQIRQGGKLPLADSITRTDVKHAKTLIDIGSRGPRVFRRSSGQTIEFIPQRDPSTVSAGETLTVRAMFKGRPLAALSAHATPESVADTAVKAEADLHLKSDAKGMIRIPVAKGGLWYIRAIHVTQSAPAAWETHWVSLVFRARQR